MTKTIILFKAGGLAYPLGFTPFSTRLFITWLPPFTPGVFLLRFYFFRKLYILAAKDKIQLVNKSLLIIHF